MVLNPQSQPAPLLPAAANDTDPAVATVQIDLLRRAGPTERFRLTFALTQSAFERARRAIRRRHPEASETEVRLLFVELHYGADLARRVRERLAAGP